MMRKLRRKRRDLVMSKKSINFPFLTVDIAYSKIYSELDSLKMCYLTRHVDF